MAPTKWLCLALLLSLAVAGTLAANQAEKEHPERHPEEAELQSQRHKHYKRSGYRQRDPEHYERDEEEYDYRGYKNVEGRKKYDDYYKGGDSDEYYPRDGPHFYKPDGPSYPPYYPKPVCPVCPENTTECNGQCLDFKTNPLSCGSCGKICPLDSTCINGNCTCNTNFTQCPSGNSFKCVDITFDVNNCGGCNKTCNATSRCANGTCTIAPDPCAPLVTCNNAQLGQCVNLTSDPEFCGTCNRRCNILNGGQCTNGQCCRGNRQPCLLPQLSFQCCGWSILNLAPIPPIIPIASAACENFGNGLIPRYECCKTINSPCNKNAAKPECCNDLECRASLLGDTCQTAGCLGLSEACNVDTDCCSNRCSSVPFLGRFCT